MNNLNSILIEGNLVRDPLHRTTPKGTSVCTFSVACHRYLKQESGYGQEVSFFDVEVWARLADNCYNLGRKGRGVRVIGHLKQDRWVDADGKTRSRVAIVGEHVEFRPDFKKQGAKSGDEESAAAFDGETLIDSMDGYFPHNGGEPFGPEDLEAANF